MYKELTEIEMLKKINFNFKLHKQRIIIGKNIGIFAEKAFEKYREELLKGNKQLEKELINNENRYLNLLWNILYSFPYLTSHDYLIHEILYNSIRHGNKFDKNKKVYCEICSAPKGFFLSISDEGDGFNSTKTIQQKEFTERGRGIDLLTSASDILYNFQDNGKTFNMIAFNKKLRKYEPSKVLYDITCSN